MTRCTHNPDCPHCHPAQLPFPDLLIYLDSIGYTGTLILDFYSGRPQWATGRGLLKTRLLTGRSRTSNNSP